MDINFYTPTLTIFDENGNIDEKGNTELIENLLKNGIQGFIVLGTTSEFYSMNIQEKKQIIDLYTKVVMKRAKLIIGTGGLSIDDTIELSNYAKEAGADAVIIMGPFFHAYDKKTILYYYNNIARNVDMSIYLYNYPDKTGYDLSSEITLELVENHKNIVGYKDSSRSIDHTRDIIDTVKTVNHEFEVYSGYDDNFLFNVISGGNGAMGALSNIFPKFCSEWVNNYKEGDLAECIEKNNILGQMMKLYNITNPFMITFKTILRNQGFNIISKCREPQVPFDENNHNELDEAMKHIELQFNK